MRDLANKMAELKFEAPLAQCEETDEWGPVEYQTSNSNITKKSAINNAVNLNNIQDSMMTKAEINDSEVNEVNYNTLKSAVKSSNGNNITLTNVDVNNKINIMKDNVDNFAEGFTGSLEDLVNTFDEKITKCFGNYEQSVEELAPVQVRSQDEIMSECQ